MLKENIFPIAIGSYGLGASRSESWADNNQELVINEDEMKAVLYSYEKGQNYIDTSYIYAGGLTMKFISEFIKIWFNFCAGNMRCIFGNFMANPLSFSDFRASCGK